MTEKYDLVPENLTAIRSLILGTMRKLHYEGGLPWDIAYATSFQEVAGCIRPDTDATVLREWYGNMTAKVARDGKKAKAEAAHPASLPLIEKPGESRVVSAKFVPFDPFEVPYRRTAKNEIQDVILPMKVGDVMEIICVDDLSKRRFQQALSNVARRLGWRVTSRASDEHQFALFVKRLE